MDADLKREDVAKLAHELAWLCVAAGTYLKNGDVPMEDFVKPGGRTTKDFVKQQRDSAVRVLGEQRDGAQGVKDQIEKLNWDLDVDLDVVRFEKGKPISPPESGEIEYRDVAIIMWRLLRLCGSVNGLLNPAGTACRLEPAAEARTARELIEEEHAAAIRTLSRLKDKLKKYGIDLDADPFQ